MLLLFVVTVIAGLLVHWKNVTCKCNKIIPRIVLKALLMARRLEAHDYKTYTHLFPFF